ncbi:hypothetical protein ACMFMI_17640, partial [Erwinia amylovora]|uniref:hypothetical protein n=1 Tax=Erwinia amylovora TaxID=552 RepID=UPI0039BD1CAB
GVSVLVPVALRFAAMVADGPQALSAASLLALALTVMVCSAAMAAPLAKDRAISSESGRLTGLINEKGEDIVRVLAMIFLW